MTASLICLTSTSYMSASCKSYYATIIPPAPIMLASPIIHVQTINWCGLLSCPLSYLSCKEITKKQIQIQIKTQIRVLIHLSMCKHINWLSLFIISCLLSSLSCKEFTKTNTNTNMSTDTFPLLFVMLKQNSK